MNSQSSSNPDRSSDSIGQVLESLMVTIQQRYRDRPPNSYTTRLFEGGAEKINKKVLEEAREVAEAALEQDEQAHDHFVYEVGDLIYHLLVLVGYKNVELREIANELARRFGTSGLEEKASRMPSTESETKDE